MNKKEINGEEWKKICRIENERETNKEKYPL